MPKIKISELRPVGSELFQDSESYLNELNDQELQIVGGKDKDKNKYNIHIKLKTSFDVISQVSLSVGISLEGNSVVTNVV